MPDIADIKAERGPFGRTDPDCIRKDVYGRQLYMFIFSYDMAGKQRATEIWAYNEVDALSRVEAMRASLEVTGKCYRKLPVLP